ncbi:hypothetical protein ASD48_41035 [Streptomyces sp. Root1310]|nr:hypothetical protein ASD48_41035 [Streptomyces sp. Root1310]
MIYLGDYGIDYLLTHPGRRPAQQIASWEGDLSGAGLTWDELVRLADSPSPAAGVSTTRPPASCLVLPLLTDSDVPESAPTRLSAALISAGAPQDTVFSTAEHLLTHLTRGPHHDPAWGSSLSGG